MKENNSYLLQENEELNMPAVILREMSILPGMIIHFDLSSHNSIMAVEKAMMADQRIFVVTLADLEAGEPDFNSIYHVGTIAEIKQVIKMPNQIIRILIEGAGRGVVKSLDAPKEGIPEAAVERAVITDDLDEPTREAMKREAMEQLERFVTFYPKLGKSLGQHLQGLEDIGQFADQIAINMPIGYVDKQRVLESLDVRERYGIITDILARETEVAGIRMELAEKIKNRVDKNQKEYILREQLGYIREELGEDNTLSESDQFMEELRKLKADDEVKGRIEKEINRFKSLSGNSSESAVERGYIETLLDIPWEETSGDNTDIRRAREILERDHYGLDQVKERVLEFLAVRSLTEKGQSPIICLIGPPGTGKTSIARSVAEALDKRYVRICLGGVRDEAEIRGHRKTYVGAMPGRIVAGLRQAGVRNPLMLLDEIDKVSGDYKGDTASALLEVLDSEQNSHFRDHYVELPIDLSEVLFVATANTTQTIPRPLLDRMEIIEVTSYTANEKFHIAKEHLVSKQLQKNGLDREQLALSDGALKKIIESYIREAGVRELERKIGEICRKAAKEILLRRQAGEKNGETGTLPGERAVKITAGNLEKYLGKPKYSRDMIEKGDQVGIVHGLAWTDVGGVVLQVEVNVMPGKGEVDLTGQMGDVMKESALTGMSYVRSVSGKYGVAADLFRKNDFHLHIPEGAVPKDGPSAGITMATALLSAISGMPVKGNLAMTGEITLRGRVLPVGGLKEKILAARTMGITTVLVPEENKKDVEELSGEIRGGLTIHLVKTMEDVLNFALRPAPAGEQKKTKGRKEAKEKREE